MAEEGVIGLPNLVIRIAENFLSKKSSTFFFEEKSLSQLNALRAMRDIVLIVSVAKRKLKTFTKKLRAEPYDELYC